MIKQAELLAGSKRIIAAGTKNWLAFEGDDEDDWIQEYCESMYGWKSIRIVRQPHIVKVQPREE